MTGPSVVASDYLFLLIQSKHCIKNVEATQSVSLIRTYNSKTKRPYLLVQNTILKINLHIYLIRKYSQACLHPLLLFRQQIYIDATLYFGCSISIQCIQLFPIIVNHVSLPNRMLLPNIFSHLFNWHIFRLRNQKECEKRHHQHPTGEKQEYTIFKGAKHG